MKFRSGIHISPARPHSKKTSVAREQKRRNVCNFSRTDCFCLFFINWKNSGKEVIYGKKNGGYQASKRVKSLRSSQRDHLFTLSRHCVTFPIRPGSTAIPKMEANFAFTRKVKMTAICNFVSLCMNY